MVFARCVLTKRCPGAVEVLIDMTNIAVELTTDPTTKSMVLSELGFQHLLVGDTRKSAAAFQEATMLDHGNAHALDGQ